MADVESLLIEVGQLPNVARSLLTHNERELIEFCQRLGTALREEYERPSNGKLIELLARVHDEPLATLPGSKVEGPQPFELRLFHFRPDLSEEMAAALESLGQ